MVYHYAPRITRAFCDISNALQDWNNISTRFIVCQHDADESVRQTHVHLGMWGLEIQEEALKRRFNSSMAVKLSGNEDWKWKSKRFPKGIPAFTTDFVEPGTEQENQIFKYLKYCIKGDLSRVKMVKNISQELLDAAAVAWVEEVNPDKSPDVIVIEHKRVTSPPYQQVVIADAAERWYAYKRECKEKNEAPDRQQLKLFVCLAMRAVSKGINPYQIKELAYAVLFDDLEYREFVLNKISL